MKNLRKRSFFVFSVIIGIFVFISSCDNGNGNGNGNSYSYPSLKLVNQSSGGPITSVKFVGYEFNNLNITAGNSQTFALMNGMLGGYNNINIVIIYDSGHYLNKNFSFLNGNTTTVTLKGSSGEGSPDYNNWRLE
jgi:hypothetical protein